MIIRACDRCVNARALASILTARFNRRSIKETKNALFHARSGNGP